MAGVLAVQKDALRKLDTDLSPKFLGLTGRNGLWSKVGGRTRRARRDRRRHR